MDPNILDNWLVVSLVSAGIGVCLTFVAQRLVNKRGLFTYFVQHNRIGVSADDAVFGSVRVTWNDNPVSLLYSSTVELKNESLKDYKNVILKVFSNDTQLLTEQPEFVGTTRHLQWTKEFADKLTVEPGSQPTQEQWTLYGGQREYLLPTMNRGQVVRVTYLNAVTTGNQPSLWVEIVHKGVKVKIRMPQTEFMGISQPAAALAGCILGLFVFGTVIRFIDTTWIAAVVCMTYGLVALIPGAICIKSWRWAREVVGD